MEHDKNSGYAHADEAPMNYSVLMSVYHREQPAFLRSALGSICAQSLPPRQIVLVCDGTLTEALERVILEVSAVAPDKLCLVRLPQNKGLGPALNAGLSHCCCEYVARMDTDDIACPDRCEKQIAYMLDNGLDLCSGTAAEFTDTPEQTTGMRRLPSGHAALVRYAKRRNPMNHPCVMFKRSAVEQAGGYQTMPLFEDYDLWVRMIQKGAKLGNCEDVLLYMRAGAGLYQRRGGVEYCRCIRRFYQRLKEERFISEFVYLQNILLRCTISILPNGFRSLFYRHALRQKARDVNA